MVSDRSLPDQLEPYTRDPDQGLPRPADQTVAAPDSQPSSCITTGCFTPPNDCYGTYGTCDPATKLCLYTPLPQGTSCVPSDPCEENGSCDGQGTCIGTPMDCSAPNTSGGTCVGGVCQGFVCDAGFTDCNGDTSDGCEADLSSDPANCGSCQNACAAAGANTTGGCEKGQCTVACVAPYEDCNNDLSDGCEIPVGVPNSCNKNGLSTFSSATGATPGCGTPHCGPGKGFTVKSFGTWHCSFCTHCQLFDDGYAWCMVTKGRFSAQRCNDCCNPQDPKFPQVCP